MEVGNRGFTLLESLLYLGLFSALATSCIGLLERSKTISAHLVLNSEHQSDVKQAKEKLNILVDQASEVKVTPDAKNLTLNGNHTSTITLTQNLKKQESNSNYQLLPKEFVVDNSCGTEGKFLLDKYFLTAEFCLKTSDGKSQHIIWHFKI